MHECLHTRMGLCTHVQLSKQAEETRTGLQHYGLKSAATIPPGDGRLGWWDVSDETLDVTKQPFLLGIVGIGTIPQHENHNLVIPNHFGRHAKIEPIPFFVALLFLFLLSSLI